MTSDETASRRQFITGTALAGVGVAIGGCAPSLAASSMSLPRPVSVPAWDDTWAQGLDKPGRAVFDAATIEAGIGIAHVGYYMDAMRQMLGADPQVVLVVRHVAVPIILSDAMWARYSIGESERIAVPRESGFSRTNIFAPRIDAIRARGAIILTCDVALAGFAGRYARASAGVTQTVLDEMNANLLPGVIRQPSGVYAAHRAQQAGCTYLRSS